MTDNKNGKLHLSLFPNVEQDIAGCLIGNLGNGATYQFRIPVEVRTLGLVSNFGFDPTLILRKVVRNMDRQSPDYGRVTSRDPASPGWGPIDEDPADEVIPPIWFGSFYQVSADENGNEISPVRYFFTPHDQEKPSPLERVSTTLLQTFSLELRVGFTEVPEPGSYQADWFVTSNGNPIGKMVFTLDVQDVAKNLQGDPKIQWFHIA